MSKNAWWLPILADEKWCTRIRSNYPNDAAMDDESLRNKYANGRKYAVTWDHLGDAYDQFESLADAYRALVKRVKEVETQSMKTYCCHYFYKGTQWSIEVRAESFEDAEHRLTRIGLGSVDGELMANVKCPTWIERVINTLFRGDRK